jgi:hypothetical protein
MEQSWFRRAIDKAWNIAVYPFIVGITMSLGELLVRLLVYNYSSQDTIYPFVTNTGGTKSYGNKFK